MVFYYLLFRCVLLTVVGGVSSFAYASLDDGIAHYNYNRTSVRYALIMYCCAARSERNSSYRLCCSNGKRNCNTNATIGKQDLGEAVVCNRKHYGCVTAASRSILLAAHLSAFRVRRSYSKSCCTFQFLRVPVQETRLFARIPGCQLSRAVESRKHVR